ncbi:MAG: (Fe-S)-binding protein [Calditrichaeota bacterium]|nr:MAG: (Fe-S)-binding protein [Calditrichota bacterium]
MKISFFVTCITDAVLPHVGIKSVELLERLGCSIYFNPRQTCCGQPLANTGYHEKAKKSMRLMIDSLLNDDVDYVVAPSGSCVLQVKEYPHFFKGEKLWQEKATLLAEKTREITDFIVNVLGVVDVGAKFEGIAAYHPSCHMTRLLGVKTPPLLLLEHVQGLTLKPFKGQDKCCGFGGTFAVKMSELSGAMVADKVRNIAAAGVDYVIGADNACLMNIEARIKHERLPIKVFHIVEVLAGGASS